VAALASVLRLSASTLSPGLVLFIPANGPSFLLAGLLPSESRLGGFPTDGDSVILSGRLFCIDVTVLVDCHAGAPGRKRLRTSQNGHSDPAALNIAVADDVY